MLLDHVGFNVSDFASSRCFFTKALAPLGIGIAMEGEGWAVVGSREHGYLWFGAVGKSPGPIHIAFAAKTREAVSNFHAAALAAGGKDNGGPGLRPQYHPNYYGAFVIGPDGHNIERFATAPRVTTRPTGTRGSLVR
jgi:catechol 2,3-dioxygenase-like lactoylglutathione lyase family enzyme